jgi:serine/threonine protein kinase
MQKLYEKIMKGQYARIPKMYSQDLAIVIKSMLQVKPKYRPTCSELLEHEIVKKRLKNLNLESTQTTASNEPVHALDDLNNNFSIELPLPNYDTKPENKIVL